MGDHFPHEVGVDIVFGAGGVHCCQHGAYDPIHFLPVTAESLSRAGLYGTYGQDCLHIRDTLRLLRYDPFSDLLKRDARGYSYTVCP